MTAITSLMLLAPSLEGGDGGWLGYELSAAMLLSLVGWGAFLVSRSWKS